MTFKEYDEFIEKHKYDILYFIIYYNLKCNDDFDKIKKEELDTLMDFIHHTYIKDEFHIDLGHICDIALEHKDEIINNEQFSRWDLMQYISVY